MVERLVANCYTSYLYLYMPSINIQELQIFPTLSVKVAEKVQLIISYSLSWLAAWLSVNIKETTLQRSSLVPKYTVF